jgi:hypothetical protein
MRIARHGIPLGLACAVLATAAPMAEAADPGFTCRSSVLRTQPAAGSAVEPLAANRLGARCADDTVGLERLGTPLPGDLGLDMAFAATATTAGRRQFVDCGRGRDEVRLNYGDRQRRCERVLRVR